MNNFIKTALYIFILFTLSTIQIAFGQAAKSDKIFISKDSLRGFSQSIFFETNKNSKYYKNITSFRFGIFDKESYNNSLDYLKANKIKLKKQKTILPSTKWIILKQYQGQFYAYYPCDFYKYYQVSINDTTYIDWTGEGPIANKIVNQVNLNDTTFQVNTTGINQQNRTITIHIIDRQKGIAIFEDKADENSSDYYLMIMADKIKSVPFIVNNCETYKQHELKFDKPDFDKLLKKE